jgi:simple sugar transport system ATP-binding protein
VRGGEITGIAGVAGNGQSELADVIAGLAPALAGSVRICGQDVTHASVARRRHVGLANIPEDRYKRGLALEGSLADNLMLGSQRGEPISRRGLVNLAAVAQWARALIARFQIKAEGPPTPVRNLSGGNAQKTVVARELAEPKPLILAAQPTRGIDVASTEFVRGELLRRRNEGAGVLLISADLTEVMSLSDRILVMFSGRIVGQLSGKEATETRLGLLMCGVQEEGHDD